jgi:RimJ/RimL family protein N-acetyltransferase
MRNASFRVFIGDKLSWDRGIGTDCARLMLRYGFEKLNLNRIWLGVNAANERAVRAYEKAGFVREGLLRQEQFRNARYYDVVRMAVLREEYTPANARG